MTHVNITGKRRDADTYILIWPDNKGSDAYRAIHSWASNPQLNFTWWDCAKFAASIRDTLDMRDNTRTSPAPLREMRKSRIAAWCRAVRGFFKRRR